MTEITEQAYDLLRKLGIVKNREEFCIDWLRRNVSYAWTIKALNLEPSIEVMVILASRLIALRTHLMVADGSTAARAVFARAAIQTQIVEDRLWNIVHDRCSHVAVEARAAR
jgi:hypothetical protein